MVSFNNRLKKHITELSSYLCVGLDISPESLGSASSLSQCIDHANRVIDATIDLAAAFKPNLAFFEQWGSAGYKWLEDTMEYINNGTLTIADGKRGDIGNTAEKYAQSIFDHFGFDAATVNPYMGEDAIVPFIKRPDKGAFILCKTSNPSSGDFQNSQNGQKHIFELVARKSVELNSTENVGLVVGATIPEEIKTIRRIAPELPFLIPGVGAQGGDLEKSMQYGNENGLALISISRGIIFSGDKTEKAIRSTAKDYKDKMMDLVHG